MFFMGAYSEQLKQLIEFHAKHLGLNQAVTRLNSNDFKRPETGQLNLF
jgi:hypothetical protein